MDGVFRVFQSKGLCPKSIVFCYHMPICSRSERKMIGVHKGALAGLSLGCESICDTYISCRWRSTSVNGSGCWKTQTLPDRFRNEMLRRLRCVSRYLFLFKLPCFTDLYMTDLHALCCRRESLRPLIWRAYVHNATSPWVASTLTLYASSDCRPLRLDSVHHLRWVHEEQPSAISNQVRPQLCAPSSC